jgi:hypothetical protein
MIIKRSRSCGRAVCGGLKLMRVAIEKTHNCIRGGVCISGRIGFAKVGMRDIGDRTSIGNYQWQARC